AAQNIGTVINNGIKKMASKNYRGAIQDFTTALEELPDEVNLYVNRSIAKRSLKDYAGAVEDLSFALEIEPNNGML
ncbi:hypothetical protein ACEV7R_23830, partial [Vibrio parahaemolyticus]